MSSLLHALVNNRWLPVRGSDNGDGTSSIGAGGGGSAAVVATPLLSGATSTGPGAAVNDSGKAPSFTGRVAGTGAVSATVQIQVRNDAAGEWLLLGTLTMSGTTVAADGFGSAVRYLQYRANVTAISGTSAAVTVTMGS